MELELTMASDVRIFRHENGDIAIQWEEDQIYIITEGTTDLVEDTHGVLDYGTWTEWFSENPGLS